MFTLVISVLRLGVAVVLLVSAQLFLSPESFITARLRTLQLQVSVFLIHVTIELLLGPSAGPGQSLVVRVAIVTVKTLDIAPLLRDLVVPPV